MGLSVSVTPSEAYPDGTPVTRAMLRNAASAMEFFSLPTNRVVELGSQVRI